jgi:hypothetical protein
VIFKPGDIIRLRCAQGESFVRALQAFSVEDYRELQRAATPFFYVKTPTELGWLEPVKVRTLEVD